MLKKSFRLFACFIILELSYGTIPSENMEMTTITSMDIQMEKEFSSLVEIMKKYKNNSKEEAAEMKGRVISKLEEIIRHIEEMTTENHPPKKMGRLRIERKFLRRDRDTLNDTNKAIVIDRLQLLRSKCSDAETSNTSDAAWLNILQESKTPHAMELRYRIKNEGLTFATFAHYAAEMEKNISDIRHPPQLRLLTEEGIQEEFNISTPEESLRLVLEIILIPFSDDIDKKVKEDGLFGTFVCLLIRKLPEGTKVEKIKEVVRRNMPDVKPEDIHFKFITTPDELGIHGEGHLCFNDHETAITFWRDTNQLKLGGYVGFRPVEGTKETLGAN